MKIPREYKKIYTGTNQENGYDNPFLGYSSDLRLIAFEPDVTTYFHIPSSSFSVSLSTSGLIEDGAVAGGIPFCSDKVWKKNADYANYVNWGDAQSSALQDGVWLCAWLSAGPQGTAPVWKERWYNPGRIDSFDAYIANTSGAVIDMDSNLTFDAEGLYAYYHFGNKSNQTFLNLFSGNLVIDYDSGVTPTPLNGTTDHLSFNYSSANYPATALTYCVRCYADDWSNIKGHDILSSNYRGGYTLRFNSGFHTPFVVCFDKSTNSVLLFNNNGDLIQNKQLPGVNCTFSSAIDRDGYIWVLDTTNNRLYKLDSDCTPINSVTLNDITTYKMFYINRESQIVLLRADGYVEYYNNFCRFISTSFVGTSINFIDQNCNGAVFASSTSGCTIDNTSIVVTPTGSYNLHCDSNNNIWALEGSLKKYSNVGGVLTLSTSMPAITGDSMNLTHEYSGTYIWIVDNATKTITKYDINGSFIFSFSYTGNNIYSSGDWTGYNWHRKYNYVKNGQQPTIDAEICVKNNTHLLEYDRYTLSVPCSGLADRSSYLFIATYSPTLFRFYIDTDIKGQLNPGANGTDIFYNLDNNLYAGADVGKYSTLDQELNTTTNHFLGSINEVRVHNDILISDDNRCLQMSKFDYQTLYWNMPVGSIDYIEEIEKFFKNKLPGGKSQFYNIKIVGLNITDTDTRVIIEDIIRDTVKRVAPVYSELYKIIWE